METQTVEWKRVWDEKYLKQICAFANSDGGVMKVGIDDDGTVVGVKDPKSIMKKITVAEAEEFGALGPGR